MTFKWRGPQAISTIFKTFLPSLTIEKILDQLRSEDLIISFTHLWHHIPTIQEIYIVLAIAIRIQGLHIVPQKIAKKRNPLREAIMEAKNHFEKLCPSIHITGVNIISKSLALSLFNATMFEEISNNFQSSVIQLGEACAGDEKLFHFTGKTRDIRLVPCKPGRIGLWNYQLCVPMRNGGQFLLYTRMSYGGEGLPVSEVVKKWAEVVTQYEKKGTLLTMDSYYMDNNSQKVLVEAKVKYVSSFSSNRFKAFKDLMNAKVTNPGDWYGLYHAQRMESVVFHWSNDHRVGKSG